MPQFSMPIKPFHGAKSEVRFIAFIDILGFSDQVIENFENTLKIYEEMVDAFCQYSQLMSNITDIKLSIYSDSIILTSSNLESITEACTVFQIVALSHRFLTRGGIGYGNHIENRIDGNVFIVSQALVNAAKMEKTVHNPCISLHPDIALPSHILNDTRKNIEKFILNYENAWIINPFNKIWLEPNRTNARAYIGSIASSETQYKDKYIWLANYYDAVSTS